MKFILGKKLGMTGVFDEKGKKTAGTVIQAGPCFVTQKKDENKDGYRAVQIGYMRSKKENKAILGHIGKKYKKDDQKLNYFKEFPIEEAENINLGQEINVSVFEEGEFVSVSSRTKGRGFAGVMKRHGFHGSPATHGHRHDHRAPGSIGAAFPEHVMKGLKMAGRYGNDLKTVKNLKVLDIDIKNNLLVVSGSVSGPNGGMVVVKGDGMMEFKEEENKVEKQEAKVEIDDKKKDDKSGDEKSDTQKSTTSKK